MGREKLHGLRNTFWRVCVSKPVSVGVPSIHGGPEAALIHVAPAVNGLVEAELKIHVGVPAVSRFGRRLGNVRVF